MLLVCSFQAPLPLTLLDLYAKGRTEATAHKEFVVYQGERLTYADVLASADALAERLQHAFGVAKGDRCVSLGVVWVPHTHPGPHLRLLFMDGQFCVRHLLFVCSLLIVC